MSFKNLDNAKILYEFLITEQNYQNNKLSTKITPIKAICLFNQYIHYKDFEKITKNDIMDYLNSLRKTELDDPNHKWIGTYNARQMTINKFFRGYTINTKIMNQIKRNGLHHYVCKELNSFREKNHFLTSPQIFGLVKIMHSS